MDSSADELALTVEEIGTTTVIRPVGDLDMHAAGRLLDAVESHLGGTTRRVELDGSGLGFVDSAGLRSLVQAREAAVAVDCRFVITGASPALQKVLEITGLDAELS